MTTYRWVIVIRTSPTMADIPLLAMFGNRSEADSVADTLTRSFPDTYYVRERIATDPT